MNDEAMRKAFEDCITEGGRWPKAVERMPDGTYKLIQTHAAWRNYQHGWQAATRAAVPDGWKLVPVEPTVKMIDAGLSEWNSIGSSIDRTYDAIIAAAPEVKP